LYINNYGKTSGTIKKQAWFTSINQSGVLTLQLPEEYMPSRQNLVFIEVKKKQIHVLSKIGLTTRA
jgi:hypothetical protein